MKPTSQDYKEALAKLLSDATNVLDNIYYSMREELEKEIIEDKVKREKIDQETNNVYGSLNYNICENIIKKKLPWNVRLFNKPKCCGFGVHGIGRIMIAYSFSYGIHNYFECILTTDEIKRLI